jgi:hypothetical protein
VNPAAYRPFLIPVVGGDVAETLIQLAHKHKASVARSVTLPSFVIVALMDEIVRLRDGEQRA